MSQDVALARPATVPMESVMGAVNAFEIWENSDLFAQMQKAAVTISRTQVIPKAFQGKPDDCFIGLAIARATRQDPIMVLQSLYVADGRAGWYSKYLIARANASGIFTDPIVFEDTVDGTVNIGGRERPNISVTALATLARTGKEVRQTVDLKMAAADGWTRNKKYETIPKRMLEWRSASWLINLYAPHILFGLPTAEELQDVHYEVVDDVDAVVRGRPQIADYAPGEGAGAPPAAPAAQTTTAAPKATRTRRTAAAAQASPPPPPAEEPKEPAGTVGGAQMTGNDEEQYHVLTIVNAAGADFTYKIPDQQEKLLSDWTALVNSLKGAGYAACEKTWNANVAEVSRMGDAGWPGLHKSMQDAISGMARNEKAREKAEAEAQTGKRQDTPPADPPPADESGPSSTGSDAASGSEPEGEPEPLDFVTLDGEVKSFDLDVDAEQWLHEQITSFTAPADLAAFYESNQALMDELGFAPVVEAQTKAITKAPAPMPTATPAAAAGKKWHPAVKPLEVQGNDAKLAFAALSKVMDELRGDNAKPEDYAELARINEALISHIKGSLKQWFGTLAKRFSAQGVTV